ADDQALSELVKGAKFVFHCAALVTQASYAIAYEVNVEGTRRLARAAAANGCQRFIHLSSVAVYSGTTPDGDYTEDTALREDGDMAVYSLTKLRSEHALQEVAQGHGLEYAILRPTCVYGPHTKSYTLAPIEMILKGLPVLLGDGQGLLDAVYVDDVVSALVLAAHSPHAACEVFNIGHETVTCRDFYSYFGRMLDRPVKHLPISVVNGAIWVLDRIPGRLGASLQDLKKGARFLIRASQNTRRYPSGKAANLLGYRPQFTLSMGMLETEVWSKSQAMAPRIQYELESYGPLPFGPLTVVHPSSEDELVRIVAMARERRVKVKAVGSLHSQCPVPHTDGICVVLDHYTGLLKVEDPLVTVRAGMKLRDLNEALAARNLALPINGSITEQTVSGAISTGTHGGSLHFGSLSDYVEAVRIVKADGAIVDVDRAHDEFEAVILSMGLLGIISTVTFRCVPSFFLQSCSSVRTAQEVLDDFDRIHQDNLYLDMLYFAVTDQVEILAMNRVDSQKCAVADETPRQPAGKQAPHASAKTVQRFKILILRAIASLLRTGTSIQRYFTRFSVGSSYRPRVGRSDLVLAFGDRGPAERSPGIVGDMEIAIPYEQARQALTLLRDHFRKTQRYPLLPVHIRCSPQSDLWLSPAYKRKVCWLEFSSYPRTEPLFKEIHELMKPFRYRFHWGKETAANREYIREQYENWAAFARLRTDWDPNGMFLNQYLEAFFPR
ncbi:MAG TPA: D-arabinono-1,4-lactone oxidase, partial [Bryobacteraceae bacterium]